ncbi:MAG: DUF4118 domain-containing protein, partial [Pseudomonadota bacterium]|nr:DUF4118 domain-containing protein [Pseudomonadota bacterium]
MTSLCRTLIRWRPMTQAPSKAPNPPFSKRQWPGLLMWIAGGLTMLLANWLSPASIAMLLVLTSAIAALWLRLLWTLVCCLLAALAFNWFFISPRGTLAVQLQEDAILLLVMFVVSMLVAALTSALHAHARQLAQQARAIATLRAWGD